MSAQWLQIEYITKVSRGVTLIAKAKSIFVRIRYVT